MLGLFVLAPLVYGVSACKAPDGSYWALQSWQRLLPDYGVPGSGRNLSWELHLSHWTGETAHLEAWTDWVYAGRYQHLFGRLTYSGQPVYGFAATRVSKAPVRRSTAIWSTPIWPISSRGRGTRA